jgi:hypothetical protein
MVNGPNPVNERVPIEPSRIEVNYLVNVIIIRIQTPPSPVVQPLDLLEHGRGDDDPQPAVLFLGLRLDLPGNVDVVASRLFFQVPDFGERLFHLR